MLGLGDVAGRDVTVSREVGTASGDRVDLHVHVDGRLRTVLEAKVLSGLGPKQLARYELAFPDAENYLLLHPGRLVVDPGTGSRWNRITWEGLLTAFSTSNDPWVAQTGAAWLEHLTESLPHVSPDTRWNDLRTGDPIPLIMRARMSWVYGRLELPSPLTGDLLASGGSKAWVTRLHIPVPEDGYVIAAEIEDTSARAWPARLPKETSNPVTGPRIWVGLRQHQVTGSEGFDWNYLASLWPLMRAARNDWTTTRPGLPTPHDRAGWQSIGSPAGLGHGFGHREALRRGVCMFGARFQLPADTRLDEIVTQLHDITRLLLAMAAITPPTRP